MTSVFKLRSWNYHSSASSVNVHLTDSLSDKIGAIRGRLSSDCRRRFLETCWRFHLSDAEWQQGQRSYDSYFTGYEECCQHERLHALLECSHDDLCQSVGELATGTRDLVEQKLAKIVPAPTGISRDDKSVVAFIGLAILRIDLTDWKNSETLQDHIYRTLGVASMQTDRDWLPITFNVAFFNKKAGIRVR